MTNKVKHFYIRITDDMTPQMAQDAFDKCVDAGAYAGDCVAEATSNYEYESSYEFGEYKLFGVSITGSVRFYDHSRDFGEDAQEITLDQLDEWLGLEVEQEWNNGDECVWSANNQEFKFVALHCENKEIAIVWNGANNYRHCNLSDLRKPETPEQKAERERLEAAYEIYLAFWSASKSTIITMNMSEFKECSDLNYWLAVVDKTGYRKQ